MGIKKIMIIALSAFLTVGSLVCASTAEGVNQSVTPSAPSDVNPVEPTTVPSNEPEESKKPEESQEPEMTEVPTSTPVPTEAVTATPVVTVTPVPTVEPTEAPEVGEIEIKADKENMYYSVGKKINLSVNTELSGEQITYQWASSLDNGKEWKVIEGVTGNTCETPISDIGKVQYRCVVTVDGEKSMESNVITKIGYRKKVTVAVGDSITLTDLFGNGASELKGKITFTSLKLGSALEIKKNEITVKRFSNKSPKFEWEITKGADKKSCDEISINVIMPKAAELQKKASILITKNKTYLKISYKNIKGVGTINFQPKGLKIDTIKLKGNSSEGSVSYSYKKKYKMKKFRVRFGYVQAGKNSLKYTKWFWVKDVKIK